MAQPLRAVVHECRSTGYSPHQVSGPQEYSFGLSQKAGECFDIVSDGIKVFVSQKHRYTVLVPLLDLDLNLD